MDPDALNSITTSERNLRTIVFIDYQNMYRSAREAFGWVSEAGQFGNFRPYLLGRQMVRPRGRRLESVRIYTGIHSPHRDPKQHGQMQRRFSAWIAEAPDKVEVLPRSLSYGRRGAREKGVDVELAIDFVDLALADAFDVAVLASADTDLVPALKLVASRFPEKTLVTLGYAMDSGLTSDPPPAALDLPGGGVVRHLINHRDFGRMSDRRNFYLSTSDRSADIDPARWRRLQERYES